MDKQPGKQVPCYPGWVSRSYPPRARLLLSTRAIGKAQFQFGVSSERAVQLGELFPQQRRNTAPWECQG